jgi:predicted amidophosphoribosyltransferase
VCWNTKAGLCESCAPDLDEEIAAAQAAAARDQVQEKVRSVDYLAQRDLAQVASAICPACGAKTKGGKFCPECGASIAPKRKCASCGAEAEGTPKFCPECGTPYTS